MVTGDILVQFLKTKLLIVLVDSIYIVLFISIFSSFIVEAIKGSLRDIFDINNKRLNWFIHLVTIIIISSLFWGYSNTFGVIKSLFVVSIIFLGSWGLSYHIYIFVVKWLILLAGIVSIILQRNKNIAEKQLLTIKEELKIMTEYNKKNAKNIK